MSPGGCRLSAAGVSACLGVLLHVKVHVGLDALVLRVSVGSVARASVYSISLVCRRCVSAVGAIERADPSWCCYQCRGGKALILGDPRRWIAIALACAMPSRYSRCASDLGAIESAVLPLSLNCCAEGLDLAHGVALSC